MNRMNYMHNVNKSIIFSYKPCLMNITMTLSVTGSLNFIEEAQVTEIGSVTMLAQN